MIIEAKHIAIIQARAVRLALGRRYRTTSELALRSPGKFETTLSWSRLTRDTNEKGKGTRGSQAILTHRALVGAIGVARAVTDEHLTREILTTVAQVLKNPTS